jgi:hypothetical protein
MLNQTCPLSWEMLGAYVDGELGHFPPDAPWSHVIGCPICFYACTQILDQNGIIRSVAPYHSASHSLRKTVMKKVARS